MKYTREQIEEQLHHLRWLSEGHGRQDLFKYESIILQLLAENDALREDAERLDYVENNPRKTLRKHKKHWQFEGFTNYEYDVFSSVREAIDAARKSV